MKSGASRGVGDGPAAVRRRAESHVLVRRRAPIAGVLLLRAARGRRRACFQVARCERHDRPCPRAATCVSARAQISRAPGRPDRRDGRESPHSGAPDAWAPLCGREAVRAFSTAQNATNDRVRGNEARTNAGLDRVPSTRSRTAPRRSETSQRPDGTGTPRTKPEPHRPSIRGPMTASSVSAFSLPRLTAQKITTAWLRVRRRVGTFDSGSRVGEQDPG